MFKKYLTGAVAPLLFAANTGYAIEHCDIYTVTPGDTLRLIAEHYYGARGLSPVIYQANIGVIGSDSNQIEVGMRLSIPCQEGMQSSLEQAFVELMEMQLAISG